MNSPIDISKLPPEYLEMLDKQFEGVDLDQLVKSTQMEPT